MALCVSVFASCANDAVSEQQDTPATEVATTTPEAEEEVTTTDVTTTEEVTTEEVTTTEQMTTTEEVTTVTTTTEAVTTTEATTTLWYEVTPASEKLYATADLTVRAEPSRSATRISHVDKGDLVEVTGYTDNGWARIKFRDGEYFVNGSYLSTEKPVYEVTTAAVTTTTVATSATTVKKEEVITPTPEELIADMTIGWNLGNTLDAPSGETSWGQPKTTEAMIDTIKELGFNTVRIPVSWGLHTDSNYKINASWLKRVKEVVDYAIDNGMYVIINSHHDNDFYYPSAAHRAESEKYIKAIWEQVAECFKDYDYHLIFECMNEPRLSGTNYEWYFDANASACKEAATVINSLNQIYVDTVRASGGNNTDRYLMVTPYDAGPSAACNSAFKLPTDTASDRLIVSVHAYTPYDLAMNANSSVKTLGTSEKSSIDSFMKQLYTKYVSKGIPVIIGETGCINKDNYDERYKWAYYFVSTAKKYGLMVCVWENSNDVTGEESYALFNRRTLKIYDNSLCIYNGIMDAVNDAS